MAFTEGQSGTLILPEIWIPVLQFALHIRKRKGICKVRSGNCRRFCSGKEYTECINKAKAVVDALKLAEEGEI